MRMRKLHVYIFIVFLWTCGGGGGKAPTEPEDSLPVAVEKSTSTDEDTSTTIALEGNDPGGATALIFSISDNPSNGTVTVENSSAIYTPNLNFFGEDVFYYRVSNGLELSTPAKVTVNVLPINDAPIAINQYVSTNETKFIQLSVTLEAQDVDGDNVTFSIVNSASNGSLTGSGNTYTYIPNTDYNGADQFTFKANDGQLDSNIASVVIGVNPVNDTPTTNNFSLETLEDTELIFTFSYTDVDNDNVTFQVVQSPSNGTINLNDQYATYVPNSDYFGTDSFTYKANDGTVDSNVSTVSISVVGVNDPPVAIDRQVSLDEDTIKGFNLNASDAENDVLEYHIISSPQHGSLERTGLSNNMTYTPNTNFFGTDSVTFRAFDGVLFSENTASAVINVSNVNDNIEAYNASVSVDEDTPITIALPIVNVDNRQVTIDYVTNTTNGTLANNIACSVCTIDYTPNANFHGDDYFEFKVIDSEGQDTDSKRVDIIINSIEDFPEFMDIEYTTFSGDSLYNGSSYDLPSQDGDGDAITWTLNGDSEIYIDDTTDPKRLVISRPAVFTTKLIFESMLFGEDSKGNVSNYEISVSYQVSSNDSAGLVAVEEWNQDLTELRDPAVSYVPWASLGSTGYILENRAGEVNQFGGFNRDFDRFDYWTPYSIYDIEINFGETSLAWAYTAGSTTGEIVPFRAYAINKETNEKIPLYSSYLDWNGDGSFGLTALDGDGEPTLSGLVYGARAWDPIYLHWPFDVNNSYDPNNNATYISQDNIFDSGGCGWGLWNLSENDYNPEVDCVDPATNISIVYGVFVTSLVFTDYLNNGTLPTENGIATGVYNAGSFSGASAILLKTGFHDDTKGPLGHTIKRGKLK